MDTNGIITTSPYAGTKGRYDFSGDGGLATLAYLNTPYGVAVDVSGNVFIADSNNNRIRVVDTSGNINTFAGSGPAGYTGDNGAAKNATLNSPFGVAIDVNNNVFISDTYNQVIRLVDIKGIITTYAGNGYKDQYGNGGFNNDNIPATSAKLNYPENVGIDSKGNVYIADYANHRIRVVSLKSKPKPVPKGKSSYSIPVPGNITTFAGNGTGGFNEDGISAIYAQLYYPSDVAVDKKNNVFIADSWNNRIRFVTKNGNISTYAGDGDPGALGDGGDAQHAQLDHPYGVALDGHSNTIYIADTYNFKIRKVFPV